MPESIYQGELQLKGWKEYKSLWGKWLEPNFANARPEDIIPLDIARLKNKM